MIGLITIETLKKLQGSAHLQIIFEHENNAKQLKVSDPPTFKVPHFSQHCGAWRVLLLLLFKQNINFGEKIWLNEF